MSKTAQGKLIIVVAPSGAGKTTIAKKLLDGFNKIKFSVSATTRQPREGEKDGVDYFFLTDAAFEETIREGGFLEWEHYSGNRYGTLADEVDKLIQKGYFPLLDLEVKGAENVKTQYKDRCVSIFIEPPSIDELKRRLEKRGTETSESLAKRLKRAEQEMMRANRFDYRVINDDLDTAYKQVKTIVQSFITN